MKISMYRDDIPDWAKDNMQMLCPYCNSFIADNSDTGVTTSRWCVNKSCPGHMSFRAKELADFFGIKGFGPKSALTDIRTLKFKSHFEFIPRWFIDKKPLLTLPEIAVLACIEGIGEPTAQKELAHYNTFEEYFNNCLTPNKFLLNYKEELLYAQQFFTIKPSLSAKKMYVMGTGSFNGYSSRNEYFRLINDAYGMYINVIQTGKRKTGISYLIKEYNAVDHSKSQIARDCGIPIVTPSEFFSIIASMCPYINE